MTPAARITRSLPLVVALVTLWLAAPLPLPLGALAAALIAATAIGPRIEVDKATQRLASLVAVILIGAFVRASGIKNADTRVSVFAFGFALAVMGVAVLRLVIARVEGAYLGTAVLGFVAVMSCGSAKLGPIYGALTVAYFAAVITALRGEDPGRIMATRVPRRAGVFGALIILIAGALAAGARVAILPVQGWVQGRVDRAVRNYGLSQVRFSDTMRLGKMTDGGFLESTRIVLRLRGASVDRLRGAVLDTYDGGRWLRTNRGISEVPSARGPIAGADVVEVRRVGDDGDRAFLPWDVKAVATQRGRLRADGHGIARIERDDDELYWFRVGPRDTLPVAPPGAEDVAVLRELRRPLQRLASDWARGSDAPEEALAALERHLKSEFTYSLHSERKTNFDPVLDFLYENRVGHCEYFASAFALLARSMGIPARVVTGYRVAERNPYLGHWIVRERNAHAWVEAFVPGRGWVTYDPTPMAELSYDQPHEQEGSSALSEMLAAGAGRLEDWLRERTLGELTIAALLGLGLFVFVRWWNVRKPKTAARSESTLAFSAPLASFVAFEEALAKSGARRDTAEPLESFATRLTTEQASLVTRYARARYGQVRDETLDADLRAAAGVR